MHISEMIYWPLTAITFIIVVFFMRALFMEGNAIADTVGAETNAKTHVYQEVSDLGTYGYQKRDILIDGSSIISDVLNTAENVKVVINNAAGLPNTLTEDERKAMRNKGDTAPVLARINVSRKYTKTYAYDSEGNLSSVEYVMN
ncbi:hypothetical protein [Butyrivibrio sp. M55]|uniref:hypothetical protein n=1 Tax=Butyrivibrio sp. M55 TaxID=1855323 RepID=UPI0008F3ECFC|nr:hypothetical protein [Butyrivibrio sp. M55]SFU90804.1 hypothetical protein SAMN05216540_12012 [Butyrivibrio sp. M55]